MKKTICGSRLWLLNLLVLLMCLKPTAGYAAENLEAYRTVFDADYYYSQNPDLQASVGDDKEKLFSHFASVGAREGRSGNKEFNLRAYVFNNPDLLDHYKTDLSLYCRHYVELGKAERINGLVLQSGELF